HTNGPGTFGYDLAAPGDTNGDGVDDLAIGSFMIATGEVILLLGSRDISEWHDDASILEYEETNRVVRFRTSSMVKVGEIVSGGFDFNGDGLGDFSVGARQDGRDYHGTVFIVLGSESYGEEVRLVQLDEESEHVVRIPGPFPDDQIGQAVGLGDFNGDGIDDVGIVPWARGNTLARAYVVFGREDPPRTLALENLGRGGFKI